MMFAERRSLFPLWLLGILVLVLAAAGVFLAFRVGPGPQIKITPAAQVIGRRTPVEVAVSEPERGLSHVRVEFVQGDRTEVLADKSYAYLPAYKFWGARTPGDTLSLEIGKEPISWLKPGEATVRVTAGRAGTWLRSPDPVVRTLTLKVRLSPPTLQLQSRQTYVARGGAEAVVYRVGEGAVRDGVQSGDWWFPGFPLPGGGAQDRFAFFAVPYNMAEPRVRLVAEDAAGNRAEVSFIDQFFPKNYRSDRMELSDSFLGKVVPEILSQSHEIQDKGNPLDNYLEINRVLRQKNASTLKELAAQSRLEFLWSAPFLSIPNGKVMAGFADHRTYYYQGREVDEQDHLGYDLAVTSHAPVPAANDGYVVLARYFGIYGNTVLIDHGYGVMSLYGHLASIAVGEGKKVTRGEIIGNTGQTGLAGGDHLHYAILLHGLPVNPVEWWDGHWIKDRISGKLGAAFRFQENPATASAAGM